MNKQIEILVQNSKTRRIGTIMKRSRGKLENYRFEECDGGRQKEQWNRRSRHLNRHRSILRISFSLTDSVRSPSLPYSAFPCSDPLQLPLKFGSPKPSVALVRFGEEIECGFREREWNRSYKQKEGLVEWISFDFRGNLRCPNSSVEDWLGLHRSLLHICFFFAFHFLLPVNSRHCTAFSEYYV